MKKILVIEDNAEVRENLEEILELYGYEVTTAEDGTVGVELALKDTPDLILCDVMMPKLDGYGVLNILSKKQRTADVPFIFLTAKIEKSDFRRGMNLGADDYITKPFYKDELLQVIETRLKKSERLRRQFDGTAKGWSAFIDEAKGYRELKKLSGDRNKRTFSAKQLIFSEGDFPRYLFFVIKGKVKIFKTNDFGKEFIISLRKSGDFIGYTALIKNENYRFAATALTHTEVSLIPKDDFLKLLHLNRDVASRLIKMLADNVASKEEQLLDLAYNSVRKRVAKAIVELHKAYQKEGKSDIRILRDDLAHIVGTAKESVIRMLTEFREDGYIDIEEGLIQVTDLEKLKRIPA